MVQVINHRLPADYQGFHSYQPFARYIRWQSSLQHIEEYEQPIDRLDSLVALNQRPWLPSFIQLFYRTTTLEKPTKSFDTPVVFTCYINPTVLTFDELKRSKAYPVDKRDLILDEMRHRKVDVILHLSNMPPGKGFHFYDRNRDHIKRYTNAN